VMVIKLSYCRLLFHIDTDLSSQSLRGMAPPSQTPLGVENQFTYAEKPDLF